jgi:hypothetical protein
MKLEFFPTDFDSLVGESTHHIPSMAMSIANKKVQGHETEVKEALEMIAHLWFDHDDLLNDKKSLLKLHSFLSQLFQMYEIRMDRVVKRPEDDDKFIKISKEFWDKERSKDEK